MSKPTSPPGHVPDPITLIQHLERALKQANHMVGRYGQFKDAELKWQTEINALKAEVSRLGQLTGYESRLKTEISALQKQNAQLQSESGVLKNDKAYLQSDQARLQSEAVALLAEITTLKTKLKALEKQSSRHKSDANRQKDLFTRLSAEVDVLCETRQTPEVVRCTLESAKKRAREVPPVNIDLSDIADAIVDGNDGDDKRDPNYNPKRITPTPGGKK